MKKNKNEFMIQKEEIYKEFQALKTVDEKVAYCREMDGTTQHLKLNWKAIGDAWQNNSWPKFVSDEKKKTVKKAVKKKEEEEENTWAKSYVDPVGQTDSEKPLTQQELDALL